MSSINGNKSLWISISLSIAIIVSVFVASTTWERVKTRPKGRIIEVTGSAKKGITSDEIQWSAHVETSDQDRTAAYQRLAKHVQIALAYLGEQGVNPKEIRVSSAEISEVKETEVIGKGEERIEKSIFKGYKAEQQITVCSRDVERVERISREITQLLEKGVSISSTSPLYFYTKLGELKVEMLAAAAHDARTRALSILEQTGGARLGKIRSADMGIINVNEANSTKTSWEGNNDTSSFRKDVIAVTHVTFELD